jgi:hypothetical protein
LPRVVERGPAAVESLLDSFAVHDRGARDYRAALV